MYAKITHQKFWHHFLRSSTINQKYQIETSLGKLKTSKYCTSRHVTVLSTLFNLSIDHILDEISKSNVAESWIQT